MRRRLADFFGGNRLVFTGIVTDIGHVRSIERPGDVRVAIQTSYDTDAIDIGASIACSGVCLTVVDKGRDGDQHWFAVDVSDETLECTTLAAWESGTAINLERAMRPADEFGGHIVSGHVDAVGEVASIEDVAESKCYRFRVPSQLKALIAAKGSIAVDGVSLTVNTVDDAEFAVNLIPHTQKVTTLGMLRKGDKVNLEIDMLARYVARLMDVEKNG